MLHTIFPQLGKNPSGKRLEKIQTSSNFKKGKFQNIDFTPNISKEFNIFKLLKEYIQPTAKFSIPKSEITSIKNTLHELENNQIVWFGHSSYLLKMNGITLLVDPVFSGYASPFPFGVKAFKGTNYYQVAHLPPIDLLLITHDHYDHLDYKTIKELYPKVKKVVCGLGVGAHFEFWGYSSENIIELDWYEEFSYNSDLKITATPVRHFSGRGLKRNNTLFCSFVLQDAEQKIFVGGDTGYGTHLKEIGQKYGPFDFGIIECGQYNPMWKEIHALPSEWKLVVTDLKIKKVMPVHFGKFKLALHDWFEPVELFVKEMQNLPLTVQYPKIGEMYSWKKHSTTNKWWKTNE